MYPEDRQYTKEHEWIAMSGTRARVGITEYAQKQLGDVVFVGAREQGLELAAGGGFDECDDILDPDGFLAA